MDTTTPLLTSIGIDIGKEVFHVVGFSTDGKIAFRRKIKRLALIETFRKLPPSIVGMEACLSAHFVSRTLRKLGHEPRIIPAIYVKPFVKGKRTTTTMPRRLLKHPYGRTYAPCARRPRISLISRLAIAFAPAWSRGGLPRSIRSEPSLSSKASWLGPDRGLCATLSWQF